MKKNLILLAAFYSLNTLSQSFVILHEAPDSFAKILTSTISKEIYPDKTFLDFSISQQTTCLEEGSCFDEIGKLSSDTNVIYLSRYQNEFESFIYLTFIDLKSKKVTRSLGKSCEFCTKLEQIDMVKSLLIGNIQVQLDYTMISNTRRNLIIELKIYIYQKLIFYNRL